MTRYLLSIYQPDGPPPPTVDLGAIMRDVGAVMSDLKASGALVVNGGLAPADTATVVRHRGEEVLMTDGPFAEAKEHVGGLVVIQVADLDAALRWASRLGKATTLPIEVRPFQHGG